ncbi:MAG: O-antigen ligase family protein [Elusimicrobiota bacterium]
MTGSSASVKKSGSDTATLIAVFLWLAFIFSLTILVDVKHTRYKLIGMELSILLLTGLWFWRDIDSIGELMRDSLLVPLVSLGTVFTFFYLFSHNRPLAFSQWQRIFFSCLVFFLSFRFFPAAHRHRLMDYLLIAGWFAGIYGLLQRNGGIGMIRVPRMTRVFSTFGNPNFFASFLAGLIPLAIASFMDRKKLWKLLMLTTSIIALYYTATRGAWLGLSIALVLWMFIRVRDKKKVLLITLLFFLVFGWFTRAKWMRATERLMIWRDTLKMSAEFPVSGVGLGEFHSVFPEYASAQLLEKLPKGKFIVNYAHNEFLEVLAETGITGFGIYLWFLFIYYRKFFTTKKPGIMSYGAVFGATAVLIHSAFSVNMRFAVSSIWAFALMGMALVPPAGTGKKSLAFNPKKALLSGLFFAGLFFAARIAVEPVLLQKKLAKDVDFFDLSEEYDQEELMKEIRENPQKASTYYELGWEQAKKKDFKNAIINFQKTISLDSSRVGAYNNLGNIYYTMGNAGLAEKYYTEAVRRNPGLTDAHFNLGFIYYYQGRLKPAAEEFNAVLQLEPDNHKAKIMLEKMVQ